MAYKRKVPSWNCRCGKKAIYEVFNRYNASMGHYCAGCAEKEVKQSQKKEKEDY